MRHRDWKNSLPVLGGDETEVLCVDKRREPIMADIRKFNRDNSRGDNSVIKVHSEFGGTKYVSRSTGNRRG